MFKPKLTNILCDPKTHQNLTLEKNRFVSDDRKDRYEIIEGIPSFLKPGDVTGQNAKYQKFYDKVGRFTGSVFWFVCRLFRLDLVSKRKELLSDLQIKAGDRVLETSIGAGANIPPLPLNAEYYGVDISLEMLKACKKYRLIQPYDLQLIQANAENLPFKDATFDVVFHFGGINFFNNIPQAINEMIRVAKPGALLLIGDETQKHVDSWYSKLPFVKKYFKDAEPISLPLKYIPKPMLNVRAGYKWDDSMYVITFNKPAV